MKPIFSFPDPDKLVMIAFSVVYVFLSLVMFLPSREDPMLAYGAFAFLGLSLLSLQLVRVFLKRKQRTHEIVWLAIWAVCIACMVFPAYWIVEGISDMRNAAHQDDFRNTRVAGLHDEPLLSEKGNLIGIRLRYTIIVPRTGQYSPAPSVSGMKGRVGNFYPISVKIDPSPNQGGTKMPLAGTYEAGIPYGIIVDLVPNFLISNKEVSELCVYVADQNERDLIMGAGLQRLEIDIDGTGSSRYYGGGVRYLENEYSLKDFYDGAGKEGVPMCVR